VSRPNTRYADRLTADEYDAEVERALRRLEEANTAAAAKPPLPHTYDQAMRRPDADAWRSAIASEWRSMHDRGVFDLVPRPDDAKIISCRWVFDIKMDADGKYDKHKARLVSRGNELVAGIDYGEVFAPTLKYKTMRAALAIAAAEDLEIRQLDVKTAYLYAPLKEPAYMLQPPGLADPHRPQHVLRLNKALYGLPQAALAWAEELARTLVEFGLKAGDADPCLFVGDVDSERIIVTVYVDDLLVMARTRAATDAFVLQLQGKYSLSDKGDARSILGMTVARDRPARAIYLQQRHYVETLVDTFLAPDARSKGAPMKSRLNLRAEMGDPLVAGNNW
jgi:hypothetical protein